MNMHLVVGASGQIGHELLRAVRAAGIEARGTFHSRLAPGLRDLDVRNAEDVRALAEELEVGVIYVAAAQTNVDWCEEHPAESAEINVRGVANVLAAATELGARVVFISTDYVFDGANGPYAEDDEPQPISEYGRQKLAAEQLVTAAGDEHLIVRTTGVFGWEAQGKNFVARLLRDLRAGARVRVPHDQVATPTYAPNLAAAVVELVAAGARGVYNVAGTALASRLELAREAATVFGLDPELVEGVATSDLGQAAPRPLRGGLDLGKTTSVVRTPLLDFRAGLRAMREAGEPASADALRAEIRGLVQRFHDAQHAPAPFVPGESAVPVSGRVFDADDIAELVDASLDFWLTAGPYADRFEHDLAHFVGVRHAILCNSGSSANLLALSALTSPRLGARALREGDEVVTAASGFPTTVNPIYQNGLVPVFVDVELETYDVPVEAVEAAIGPKTRAIMLAHTLGNPFAVAEMRELADTHGLWLIEDNCDALGSTYRGRHTGTFGDLATISFYPAHHITMGEGGAVLTGKPSLRKLVLSFRDWGRDCWCDPGQANTCGKRFDWQLGELPHGYDHKYIYSHVGYNLKATDMQAAVGVAQLRKLPGFVAARRRNWQMLRDALADFDDVLVLPRATDGSEPSWFGFAITVRDDAPFTRDELVAFLEDRRIATRLLFGGNITRQPAYRDRPHRVPEPLANSDSVMRGTFWIGVYPGLGDAHLEYVVDTCSRFIRGRRHARAPRALPGS